MSMKIFPAAAAALALVMPQVFAGPKNTPRKSADDWYQDGETQYNLGQFAKAIEAFKQGFALERGPNKPAYLYNIAQAYRQDGDCKSARFFYKRYLALREADAARPIKPDHRRDVHIYIEQCGTIQTQSVALKLVDGEIDVSQRETKRCGPETKRVLGRTIAGISHVTIDQERIALYEGSSIRSAPKLLTGMVPGKFDVQHGSFDVPGYTLSVAFDNSDAESHEVKITLINRAIMCSERWVGYAVAIGKQ